MQPLESPAPRPFWQRLNTLLARSGDDDVRADMRTPAQIASDEIDALAAKFVTNGDLSGALLLAYEERRKAPEDLSAQRRYHRILLLSSGKTATMLDHARRLIAMLVQRDLASEALRVYQSCRERDATFVLDDPLCALALSRVEWRNGKPKAALALLSDFDKRFRGHAAIPQAYELAARVLIQGLDRRDIAKPILRTLEKRYPDSEQTLEVRWLMREAA